MKPEFVAVACTLLLALVILQLAFVFRSHAGRWWSAAFVLLAIGQALRGVEWPAHIAAEGVFFVTLTVGCRQIVRTRFWKRKSTMYGLLLILLTVLDGSQAAVAANGAPLTNLAVGDLALSVLLGCALIMLMGETAQFRLEQRLDNVYDTQRMLERRLNTDPLTQALSRHAFHWIQQGTEVTTEGNLSGIVVMFDLDHLKKINDTYGHAAGDRAIRAVADRIRSVIRAQDLLFRWGGDEFVAVLPNLSPAAARTRLEHFAGPIPVRLDDGSEVECRITWGIAEFGGGINLEESIRLADEHMYEFRQRRGEVATA